MYNLSDGLTSVQYGVLSNFSTTNGDCGRPVEVLTGRLSGRIVRIHIAGSIGPDEKISLCSFIDRETVTSVTKELVAQGNIDKIELVTKVDRIHMSTNSKLVPSMLHGKLSVLPIKQPAILSHEDVRSNGRDPVESFMDDIDIYHDCEIDEDILEEVFDTMSENYSLALDYPYGKRELSFEEACQGLPGHLASIYTKSSAGFPLMQFTTGQGKKQYVSFDSEGNLQFDRGFKELVELHYTEMEQGSRHVEHKWIGFLKDELVSDKKIENCNTRVIFASNMITTVAFRMRYGALLGAFNQTKGTPCAIGINQYSNDMGSLYEYLTEMGGTKFVAGDYRGFDKPGSWREVSRAVSARTTGNFPLIAEGSTHESLVTLHTDRPLKVDGLK